MTDAADRRRCEHCAAFLAADDDALLCEACQARLRAAVAERFEAVPVSKTYRSDRTIHIPRDESDPPPEEPRCGNRGTYRSVAPRCYPNAPVCRKCAARHHALFVEIERDNPGEVDPVLREASEP